MTSVEGLVQAVAGFVVADVDLAVEAAAAAAARLLVDSEASPGACTTGRSGAVHFVAMLGHAC